MSASVTYDSTILERDEFYLKLIDDKSTFIVMEDVDNYLKSGKLSFLSRLLNLGEGLIKPLNKIILTTNLDNLPPAITRPGRCFDTLHFRNYTKEELIKICEAESLDVANILKDNKSSYSLADIYNPNDKSIKQVEGNKLGFIK
jgi:SpoVK/Ycf46/Vps4 family AAA+-type ATPase